MHVNLKRNCFADFCVLKHQKYHKEFVTKFCHGFRMIQNDGYRILYDMLQILYDIIAYNLPLFYRDKLPIMRPSQGFGDSGRRAIYFQRIGEKGHLI